MAYKIPTYSVYIIHGGLKYNVTPALLGLDWSGNIKQMAQSVTIQLWNIKVNGTWMTSIFEVRDRVYIYANDGTKTEEVFRGFIWTRPYKSSLDDRNLTLKCYDNLIYLQESEDSVFYASGKNTKDICADLCNRWGIKLAYSYETITHSKLALRGNLSDIFTADVLDLVKERTGKKYVITSDKDIMYIKPWGTNPTIYKLSAGKNTTMSTSSCTMDGMTTKVVIVGKADDDGREPVEATVSGNTTKYGTLQKIISRDTNTTLEDSKKEAQSIIDEDGTPKWEYEVKGPDIPWVRLGDKVYCETGDITGYRIVTGISRTIDGKKAEMTLTMERI